MVAYTFNPNNWKAEEEVSLQIRRQLDLQSKFTD